MRKKIAIIIGLLVLLVLGKVLIETVALSPFLFQLLFSRDISLKKESHNINLLLLGIAGGAHQGPNLSDTIIFASLDLKTNKITLFSLPRDLWMPDLSGKINTAYAIGEAKQKGGGKILAKAVVKKVLGQGVDYIIILNFDGFVQAVDLIGGIDVLVERTFDDYEYPVEGKEDDPCGHTQEEIEELATSSSQLKAFPCRYTHIHFDKGIAHMDGKTALQFVRSRHAQGEEGTDFARSKRQEKVMAAFKNKIFSLETLLNPVKVVGLYSSIGQNINTDIQRTELDDFIRLAQKMKNAKMQNAVLDDGDKETKRPGLLVNPPKSEDYKNQWVLVPRVGNGNFLEIQKYVECEIKQGTCPISDKPSL